MIFIGKRTALVLCMIISCVIIFNRCMSDRRGKKISMISNDGQRYAGSEACRQCHKSIYDSFTTTPHHLTSGIASKDYIKGSFEKSNNTFVFDEDMKVVMEQRPEGLFQAAYYNGKEGQAERFDIVIGSGEKGQSYFYWNDEKLFQLPVSYFTDVHAWTNSPGFSPKKISFTRNIDARCLECHTTFAKEAGGSSFSPNQIMYGVECERCHGPAAKHVAFQLQNPQEKQGKFIINPALLSRQQKLDVCALCHSGVMQGKKPAFSFLPGDTLSKYFTTNAAAMDSFNLDVHSNQYGLLGASKCFRVSKIMDCSSCHNTHIKDKGNLIIYGQKCVGCHSESKHNFCKQQPPSGYSMVANCINCHMPLRDSKNLTLLTNAKSIPSPALVRSHLIAIYPKESEAWLKTK